MPRRLSSKLILSLTVIVVLINAVAGSIYLRTQNRLLLDTMVLGADQLSKSITSATWHAMLTDNRDVAYDIMRVIADKQGVDRIRIFNREGRLMYSTKTGDTQTVLSPLRAAVPRLPRSAAGEDRGFATVAVCASRAARPATRRCRW